MLGWLTPWHTYVTPDAIAFARFGLGHDAVIITGNDDAVMMGFGDSNHMWGATGCLHKNVHAPN